MEWLASAGALDMNGELPIQAARHNVDLAATNTASLPWMAADPSSPAPGAIQAFSFDTPLGTAPQNQCGRVTWRRRIRRYERGRERPSERRCERPRQRRGRCPRRRGRRPPSLGSRRQRPAAEPHRESELRTGHESVDDLRGRCALSDPAGVFPRLRIPVNPAGGSRIGRSRSKKRSKTSRTPSLPATRTP
jgi:hypothetical protein